MKKMTMKIALVMLLALGWSTEFLTAQSWLLTGNAGVSSTDYLGPQNAVPLNFKVNGQKAGTIGINGPTVLGYQAGNANTASDVAAFGNAALYSNTSATGSSAFGSACLYNNTGEHNSALGAYAMYANTTGVNNTAAGYQAMNANTSGYHNTGIGSWAMSSNTTGAYNVAVGNSAMPTNTTGSWNTALGALTLENTTSGGENTSIGYATLWYNTTGTGNAAMGIGSLVFNTTGSNNAGLGKWADVSTGNLSNATAIGYNCVVNASNKIRLGSSAVTVVEGPVAYTVSDGRFKTSVTEEVHGLDFITRLRPVVYNFDTRKFDEFLTQNMPDSLRNVRMKGVDYAPSTAIRQTGFIAQEVAKTAREVGYDFNGVHVPVDENDNYSIAYAQFVMPLVKSVQELNANNIALQQRLDAQEALIEKLLALQSDAANMVDKASLATPQDAPFLGQNVPNPGKGETTIQYYVPAAMACDAGKCRIVVHDVSGRAIKEFSIQSGHGALYIQLSGFSDGLYSYQLIVNDAVVASKKMVVGN